MDLENKKSIYDNIIIKILIFLTVVFNSGHAFQTIFPAIQNLVLITAIIICLPVINQLIKKNLTLYNSAPLFFIVIVFCSLIIQHGSGEYSYRMFLLVVIAAFGITTVYPFDKVVDVYLKVMTVVASVALIGYFLVNNTDALDFLPTMVNTNDVEYKVGIVYNYITQIPDRNCGMFWEPGFFATHLTLSLVFEIVFKEKKINWLRIILFSVAIITANSSAGFILLVLSLGLIFVRERENSKYRIMWQIMAVIVIVLLVLLFLNLDTIISNTPLAENEYVAKLLSENVEDQSRVKAIEHNLQQFAQSPIFGIGFAAAAKNVRYVADTSTSTYLLSVFGIFGAFYTIFLVYGIFKIKKANLFTKFLLVAIFLSIVNKEPHQNILFTWMIIFYLLKDNENHNILKKDV